ncbi:MAG: flagellar filament capping protein FliD [Vallitalea sp.]|jgi:flagellar hook-associated protein 2|nr:flagellar filament capping protein FliD [Vallitalea sp.]
MAGIKFSGLASGLDTDNIIKELMKAERMKVDKVSKEKIKLEWKKDIWKEMNSKLYEFYSKQVFDLKSKGTFSKKNAISSNINAVSVEAGSNTINGVHNISVTQLATGAYLNSQKIMDTDTKVQDGKSVIFSISDGAKVSEITLGEKSTIKDFVDEINKAGLNIRANYDNTNQRIFINSTVTGAKSDIIFSDIDTTDEKSFFENLGFKVDLNGKILAADAKDVDGTTSIGSKGTNAKYTYNGVNNLESDSNKVSINGLSLTFSAKASDVTINVTQDTEAIYDKVKEFISKYNLLITEINEKIGADSARGYDPLTAEEKKAMSDDDVELWEEKIKKSLLRRDSTLSPLLSSIRGIVGSSSGVNTSEFDYHYLSDLGIVTGDYTEKGVLHINGDEDDSLYSVKTNKLKEAIEADPEKVAELLNAIGDKLYSTMQDKMKSTSLSSALTFFNDKSMDKKVEEYKDSIYKLEERLAMVEKRYYKQFSAMEKAMQMMNSQSASLVSMLGGGQ